MAAAIASADLMTGSAMLAALRGSIQTALVLAAPARPSRYGGLRLSARIARVG
jgi:hypothetical protein